jgi:hypothetical protein
MIDFLIKGTIMGLSQEQVLNDVSMFVSTLHIVMENWAAHHFLPTGEFREEHAPFVKKSYGEVRQALIALETDIHFLSVCYHQLRHTETDDSLESGVRMLYFTNLAESYFTNLRSIYDRLAVFPRIVLSSDELNSDALNKDSFNALVKSCKNSKITQAAYSQDIIAMILNIDQDLQNVRLIRDAIIHHGKEPVVRMDIADHLTIKVPGAIGNYTSPNLLPNILNVKEDEYPLYEYLRALTLNLFTNMEDMGNLIGYYYLQVTGKQQSLYYYGLSGKCMPAFMAFLFPDGLKTHLPKPSDKN